MTFGLIAGGILALMLYLFLRFGGSMSVSLRSAAEDATRDGAAARRTRTEAHDEASLRPIRQILAMKDKRQAIILLSQAILQHVVEANGLLLQRSWTAREALRRLPRTQPHLGALRQLVLASERVQFGNRDITDEEFAAHVREVSPLLQGAQA